VDELVKPGRADADAAGERPEGEFLVLADRDHDIAPQG
jgi:hypothetical protein